MVFNPYASIMRQQAMTLALPANDASAISIKSKLLCNDLGFSLLEGLRRKLEPGQVMHLLALIHNNFSFPVRSDLLKDLFIALSLDEVYDSVPELNCAGLHE